MGSTGSSHPVITCRTRNALCTATSAPIATPRARTPAKNAASTRIQIHTACARALRLFKRATGKRTLGCWASKSTCCRRCPSTRTCPLHVAQACSALSTWRSRPAPRAQGRALPAPCVRRQPSCRCHADAVLTAQRVASSRSAVRLAPRPIARTPPARQSAPCAPLGLVAWLARLRRSCARLAHLLRLAKSCAVRARKAPLPTRRSNQRAWIALRASGFARPVAERPSSPTVRKAQSSILMTLRSVRLALRASTALAARRHRGRATPAALLDRERAAAPAAPPLRTSP